MRHYGCHDTHVDDVTNVSLSYILYYRLFTRKQLRFRVNNQCARMEMLANSATGCRIYPRRNQDTYL